MWHSRLRPCVKNMFFCRRTYIAPTCNFFFTFSRLCTVQGSHLRTFPYPFWVRAPNIHYPIWIQYMSYNVGDNLVVLQDNSNLKVWGREGPDGNSSGCGELSRVPLQFPPRANKEESTHVFDATAHWARRRPQRDENGREMGWEFLCSCPVE